MGKGKGSKGKGFLLIDVSGLPGMEKKKIESFEDLRVWQQGIELVKQIYLITREGEIKPRLL